MIINFGSTAVENFTAGLLVIIYSETKLWRGYMFVVVRCRLCAVCCVAVSKGSPSAFAFRRIGSTKMSGTGRKQRCLREHHKPARHVQFLSDDGSFLSVLFNDHVSHEEIAHHRVEENIV
jgi:Uri superfamily endonuclease